MKLDITQPNNLCQNKYNIYTYLPGAPVYIYMYVYIYFQGYYIIYCTKATGKIKTEQNHIKCSCKL